MDQEKIQEFRDQQAQKASIDKQDGQHQEVVSSLNNLLMATMVSKDPQMVQVAKDLANLLQSIGQASDQFSNSSLHLLPIANQELSNSVRDLADRIEQYSPHDLAPYFEVLVKQLNSIAGTKPIVNVPQQPVTVDLSPLIKSLEAVKAEIKNNKIDIPKNDLSAVVKGLKNVQDSVTNLSFPVPNYVLPFKDTQGAATQLQLDSTGKLPVASSPTSDSTTIGTIVANGDTVTAAVVSGMAGLAMGYYGTYATGASLTIEASFDGGLTYSSVRMLQGNSGTLGYVVTIAAVSNSTAFFVADIPNGATHVRVRCSAWAAPTGAINVVFTQSAQRFATPNGAISITAGTITTLTTLTNITNWGNIVDNAAFTDGTTRLSPSGYIYDEVAGTALTENDAAAARINVNRAQVQTIEDGTTRGRYATVSAANALKVDGSAVTQPVSGTVTATPTGTYTTQETQPATPTLANVTMTGSSATLQASNTSRRNLMIFNDSGVVVYVKLGSAASSTSFTVKLVDQAYYELPAPVYTGIVTALGASGSVRVTEVV